MQNTLLSGESGLIINEGTERNQTVTSVLPDPDHFE